ncbi:thioredoxin family protein [Thermodesulfobacteriota bacterium]
MNALEEKKITAWGQTLEKDISIDLTLTRDERSELFINFCENLSLMAPKIRISKETEEESDPPVIVINNVRYQVIPAEKELDPFLSLLADQNHLAGQLSPEVRKQLDEIRLPALLKVYITPFCPFCPATVMQLLSLAAANEQVKLNVIDGALFPELAQSDNVQSSPTVLLENQFRWTGAIQIREVVDMILNRDPSQLSAPSLRDMISNGDASVVADMMIDSGEIFPSFIELLVHEKWPVRLGAMVAFEAVAEQNRELAARAIPLLWEQFSRVADTVRGDILFLFGSFGDKGVIPLLESVLSGPYQTDVKEAAAEALEEFKSG